MQNWRRLIGTTGLCLALLAPLPLSALEVQLPILLAQEDAAIPASTTIAGVLVYEDIEGGFYAVAGYRLVGEAEAFKPYLGQQVLVVGARSDEMSIFMTKAIDVVSISKITLPDAVADSNKPELRSVEATEALPEEITVDGVTVSFGQGLVVKEGILMVPLRAIVDAAGGKVGWSTRTKTATVELPDRVATFIVGATEAEMNQQGVYYFKQNMIAMGKAPEISGDRLHISADALSSILGFLATDAGDNVLALVTPTAEQTAPMPEPGDELEWGTISGSIQQITTEGRTRILIEGEAMSNGEPMLIWLTVDGNTKVLWAASQGAASVTDLTVGQTIKAALSGPVLESYPAQSGASQVTILE